VSRIRSVHPGQWTDEDFVECSFAARLLAIALRNEADDNGVFEWKPTGLKMRLFPADMISVAEILDELLAKNQVMRFDVDGRTYGAVRNFRIYQRPRSPKAEYPITEAVELYVGERSGDETSEKKPVGRPKKQQNAAGKSAQQKSMQQNAEKVSQMERREEKGIKLPSTPSSARDAEPERMPDRQAVFDAAGFLTDPPDWPLLDRWQHAGADLETEILPVVREVRGQVMARSGRAPFKLQLFDLAVRAKVAENLAEIERYAAIKRRIVEQDERQAREDAA